MRLGWAWRSKERERKDEGTKLVLLPPEGLLAEAISQQQVHCINRNATGRDVLALYKDCVSVVLSWSCYSNPTDLIELPDSTLWRVSFPLLYPKTLSWSGFHLACTAAPQALQRKRGQHVGSWALVFHSEEVGGQEGGSVERKSGGPHLQVRELA